MCVYANCAARASACPWLLQRCVACLCVHVESRFGVDARFPLLGFLAIWTPCCVRLSITPSLSGTPGGLAPSGYWWQRLGYIDCQEMFVFLCLCLRYARPILVLLTRSLYKSSASFPLWEIHVDSGSYGPTRWTPPPWSCFCW